MCRAARAGASRHPLLRLSRAPRAPLPPRHAKHGAEARRIAERVRDTAVARTGSIGSPAAFGRAHKTPHPPPPALTIRPVPPLSSPLPHCSLLEAGEIRLLRCSWLVSAEADQALGRDAATGHVTMLPMQRLLEEAPEAFFDPDEATELLDRCAASRLLSAPPSEPSCCPSGSSPRAAHVSVPSARPRLFLALSLSHHEVSSSRHLAAATVRSLPFQLPGRARSTLTPPAGRSPPCGTSCVARGSRAPTSTCG